VTDNVRCLFTGIPIPSPREAIEKGLYGMTWQDPITGDDQSITLKHITGQKLDQS